MNTFTQIISDNLKLPRNGVDNTLRLLDENCTIPFISRYRKEATGNLNEIQVSEIAALRDKLAAIQKRKETILTTIESQDKLTDELRRHIESCWVMSELEDIYLPFKPKRSTKAEIARRQGLEPLANAILLQQDSNIYKTAERYVKNDVHDIHEAIEGAKHIIAEAVNESESVRRLVRDIYKKETLITSKVVKKNKDTDEAQKYRNYFDFSEPLKRCSSYRLLAMRRGEREGFLRINISADDTICADKIKRLYIKGRSECSKLLSEAIDDALKRLLKPSIETEFAVSSKKLADKAAINVFAENLRQLLLAAPLGQKRVMGVDPGFRTGCKTVCLNEQGSLLHFEAIYPHPPKGDINGAIRQVQSMVKKYKIEAIAVGNGTASRETVAFLKGIGLDSDIQFFVVSEDGASVYSASQVAREEFPNEDVTVRGAISIARRLMDPLAELVKIDPQSIGVGQYQHDVDQNELKKSLDLVVESCVNTVGVNVNTASKHLLAYVSGLNIATAKNIIEYREKNGLFKSREELKKVPRLGPVTYTQCAGFLRIPQARNPLDNSAVHPESYGIVKRMATDQGCTIAELINNKRILNLLDLSKYVSDKVGMPTLLDIVSELQRPGRDPRAEVEEFEFDPRIHELTDLQVGMTLPGIITNITDFGAFVDIGVHQDGLIHISQLSDKYVKDPNDIVKLHQHVNVRIIDVDIQRKRISCSMIL